MILDDFLVSEETTILDTLKKINKNARGIAFVCREQKLIASVSDGDIRRSLVEQKKLDEKVICIANKNPKYLYESDAGLAEEFMKKNVITAVPVVDEQFIIKNIRFLIEKPCKPEAQLNNQVVIMAGGKGTRLKPYTDILPKPLIPVGERTIAEHILQRFEEWGCKNFNMIVNYKKNFIKSYFADCDKKWNLSFTEEQEYYGTGGGLSLVQSFVKDTFFMTNCDILIDADYSEIMRYHKEHNNLITLVCAKKKVTMPYGTIEITEDGEVAALKEKPSFIFYTNTGLYVIEPAFLDKIPKNTHIDITDVIQQCVECGEKVGTFVIDESKWMDMGQLEELEKMKEKLGIF